MGEGLSDFSLLLLTLFLIPPFSYFLVHGLIPRHLFLRRTVSFFPWQFPRLCSVTHFFFLDFTLGKEEDISRLGGLRWNKTGLFILFFSWSTLYVY